MAVRRVLSTLGLSLVFAWCGVAEPTSGRLLATTPQPLSLPFAKAGFSEQEAAAHLLDRFAFGARPAEVDAVVELGLDIWIEQQLARSLEETSLERRLAPLDAWRMTVAELESNFGDPTEFVRRQRIEQRKSGDAVGSTMQSSETMAPEAMASEEIDRDALRRNAMREMRRSGVRNTRELTDQLFANKMFRAIYSENQLAEVLADFWFNHFNIDARKREAREHLLSFERDAIRPHVLGDFSELLVATASHPAMLMYLDNARSRASAGQTTTAEFRMGGGPKSLRPAGRNRSAEPMKRLRPPKGQAGLNENYARELMELHTLGVDGGYTQQDVVEVARALSGWMVMPAEGPLRDRIEERIPNERMREYLGFVERDGFFFNAAFHDAEKKTVLGRPLPAGRGMEDGLDVLEMLSAHSSTARFLCAKLAQRFVNDQPSTALVDALAESYAESSGNIAAVLRTMVETEEFWSSRRQKIKSPMELVVSTVRALGAEVLHPAPLGKALVRLGQPLYRYQAPTGFPETSSYWVNTGALLNRMNFGLEMAEGSAAVRFDLLELVDGQEPESAEQGLRAFAAILMPYRDPEPTIEALRPAIGAADLSVKIASRLEVEATASALQAGGSGQDSMLDEEGLLLSGDFESAPTDAPSSATRGEFGALDHIVGLLIGSPEFQRR